MRRPGFTLIETLIVVTFISLLIWGGSWSYDWYVRSERADEAKEFVQKLAAAQRRYLKIHGRFLPLAATQKDAYPGDVPPEGASWGAGPRLLAELGVEPPASPFFFRVAVLTGVNEPPPEEGRVFEGSSLPPFPLQRNAGSGGPEPWFYIVAFADQDGDGEFSRIEAASWGGAVVEHERTE